METVKGAIICGFPCIGKTKLAENNHKFIDLESSSFRNEETDEFNIRDYINCAVNLAEQGRYVLLSSHKEVRNSLSKIKSRLDSDRIALIVAYPCLTLKDHWVHRSRVRFVNSSLDKDSRSHSFISERFFTSIQELFAEFDFIHVIITCKSYDLGQKILLAINQYEQGYYNKD